jgi:hypothetical protein
VWPFGLGPTLPVPKEGRCCPPSNSQLWSQRIPTRAGPLVLCRLTIADSNDPASESGLGPGPLGREKVGGASSPKPNARGARGLLREAELAVEIPRVTVRAKRLDLALLV